MKRPKIPIELCGDRQIVASDNQRSNDRPLKRAAERAAEQTVEPVKIAAEAVKEAWQRFAELQASSGILLLFAGMLAIVISNSPLADYYDLLLHAHITVQIAEVGIDRSILHWINDGLMAVFFFHVGLEVKRELREGQLASASGVVLPAAAAIGGMLVPALLYLALNLADPMTSRGWAIPMATDIAFALGVLALLGDRVPSTLRLFLLTLAIFDDLGAITVIALFYSSELAGLPLLLAAGAITVLAILNLASVTRLAAFILVGIALWFFVLKSGVHATLAGVIVAFAIPMRDRDGASPLKSLESALDPWVVYGVMPVFAFANAGVALSGLSWASLVNPVTLGVGLGLVIGKQLGVFGAVLAMIKLGKAGLPEDTSWGMLYGVVVLSGIGFTMSLFIGTLAFEDTRYAAPMRLGVLGGSLISALLGFSVLRFAFRKRRDPA